MAGVTKRAKKSSSWKVIDEIKHPILDCGHSELTLEKNPLQTRRN